MEASFKPRLYQIWKVILQNFANGVSALMDFYQTDVHEHAEPLGRIGDESCLCPKHHALYRRAHFDTTPTSNSSAVLCNMPSLAKRPVFRRILFSQGQVQEARGNCYHEQNISHTTIYISFCCELMRTDILSCSCVRCQFSVPKYLFRQL